MMSPKPFSEMLKENMQLIVSPGKSTEVTGVFCDFRIDPSTIPEGLYVYNLRETDWGTGRPATIEDGTVIVNFFGTLVTNKPINMTHEDNKLKYRYLTGGYAFEYENSEEVVKCWK